MNEAKKVKENAARMALPATKLNDLYKHTSSEREYLAKETAENKKASEGVFGKYTK
jgi:hypothetical protein